MTQSNDLFPCDLRLSIIDHVRRYIQKIWKILACDQFFLLFVVFHIGQDDVGLFGMERVKLIEKNKNSPIHRYFTDGWTVGVKFMRFCFRSNCFSTQTQLKLTGFQSHLARLTLPFFCPKTLRFLGFSTRKSVNFKYKMTVKIGLITRSPSQVS